MRGNFFKSLNKSEEQEFRQWARDNFDPEENMIDLAHHPVVVEECAKIIIEFYHLTTKEEDNERAK